MVKGRTTPNSVPEPHGWSTRCWRYGHQGQVSMVEEDVIKGRTTPNSVPEPDAWSHGGEDVRVQGGTRKHRCWWPRKGRCEGARGHQETQVLVSLEGKV